jgi:hypothetical protein
MDNTPAHSAPAQPSPGHDRLIQGLASGLTPVRRLPSPAKRALLWLAFVAAIALLLATFADLTALRHRLMAEKDMWLAVTGSTLTAALAAFAAFKLSLPDSPRTWALLPLPAAALWIFASGMGCLRGWLVPETHPADMNEMRDCLMFILALSVPLSALLFAMLRQGYPLQPGLTAAVAGLAAASAAATLLNFFHPFDAAATDLAVHAFAVALVVVVARSLGRHSFDRENFSRTA